MTEFFDKEHRYATKGISFREVPSYGEIVISERGFEYYDDHDICRCLQIAWSKVDFITVSLAFGDHWISRMVIRTKDSGDYVFAVKDANASLQAIHKYFSSKHIINVLNIRQRIVLSWQRIKVICREKKLKGKEHQI